MKKTFIFVMSVLAFQTAGAMDIMPYKSLFGFSLGYSMPKGGEWANQYGESMSFAVNAEKPLDENHAAGLEFGYDAGHEHEKETNCAPRILYLTPYFKEIKRVGGVDLYAVLGIGLYHRWTPAYTAKSGTKYSTSWSGKLGGNFTFGAVCDLGSDYAVSASLKIHHIRYFIGTPRMTHATNMTPSISITKTFD